MAQSPRLRVGVLFGGESAEHEVSVVSAQGVLQAIDRDRFDPVPFGVTKEGTWLTAEESAAALAGIPAGAYRPLPTPAGREPKIRAEVSNALNELDVAFPLIHGTRGEDGTLQGFLELLGLPYTGAGVAASALGMDKALMKAVFRQAALPTADFLVVPAHEWRADATGVIDRIEAAIGYPNFAKPANMGSSLGVSKVSSRQELGAAIEEALRYDRKALVEAAISGREIEVAVLGNDEPRASPPGEIIPRGEFYDYAAKYLDPDGADLVAPVRLEPGVEKRLQELAIAAFKAIDCAGMARVDFFLVGDDPIVNEINTIPGFTPISMYPKLWEAAGIPYRELISELIDLGLARHASKRGHRGCARA